MKTFGLIGYPLEHSFSQHYFSEKFKNEGIEARYLNFALKNITEFPGLLTRHPYLAGLNVTIPYKQQIIKHLNETDPVAGDIGAVNVVRISWNGKDHFLKGYNTDVTGFTRSLTPLLKPHHDKALILGTGGASSAVAYGLKQLGLLYRFVSRNPVHSSHVSYESLSADIISGYQVIINTTPVGMFPHSDSAPEIPYEGITPQHLAFDLVYNPEHTVFMKNCAKRGAAVKNGLEMLHLQAEAAWEIWTEQNL